MIEAPVRLSAHGKRNIDSVYCKVLKDRVVTLIDGTNKLTYSGQLTQITSEQSDQVPIFCPLEKTPAPRSLGGFAVCETCELAVVLCEPLQAGAHCAE